MGSCFATAGHDGTVRLWSVSTGKLAMPPIRASTAGGVLAIAFSPLFPDIRDVLSVASASPTQARRDRGVR
jgi:WD40 repeat protein